MKKTVIVTGVVLLSALVASATEVEQYEAYLGYNFVRFKRSSSILDADKAWPATVSEPQRYPGVKF